MTAPFAAKTATAAMHCWRPRWPASRPVRRPFMAAPPTVISGRIGKCYRATSIRGRIGNPLLTPLSAHGEGSGVRFPISGRIGNVPPFLRGPQYSPC